MKLEGFNLRNNFERAFPEESSPDFLERVAWNLKNLLEERMEKDDYCAAFLYSGLKKKEYKLDKFYFFVLWLIFCLERPWKKNWKLSLGKEELDKASDILEKFLGKFPDLPDPQILRWYRKKFKEYIAEAIFLLPMISKLEEPFKDIFGELFRELWKRNLGLEITFKFIEEISSQRYYRKRDLMRKLRINKEQCDLLLKWAKDRDLIKLKEFPQGSVWITYNG